MRLFWMMRWPAIGMGVWLGLLGCAAVGVADEVPFPGVAPFDQALMAYARGELDVAEKRAREALQQAPDDLRAHDLLCAIHRETGNEEECRRTMPSLDLPTPVNPEALLRLVMRRNPELRQAVLKIVATRATLREAQVSVGPELMVLSRFHPAGVFARLLQSVLSSLVERDALMDQAEAELLQALGEYARVRSDLVARTAAAYLTRREAEAELRYLTQAAEIGAELERVADVLYRHGVLPRADYRRIQSEASEIQRDLLRLRGRATTATAELASLLGASEAPALTLAAKSVAVESPENVRAFLRPVSDRHHRLVAARARVDGAQARKKALLWSLPRVSLRGTYGSSTEEGRGDFLEGFSIGLRVRMPVLIWPLQRARSDREDALIGMLERELERVRNELWVSTIAAAQRLKEAQQQYQAARDEARTRRMAWKTMEAKDRVGVSRTLLSVLRARLAWIEAERRVVERNFAVQRAQVQVYAAMGALPRDLVFVPEPEESPAAPAGTTPTSGSLGKRALWVWRPDFLDSADQRKFFLDFLRARTIDTVFLFASRARLERNPASFRSFLRLAHEQGVDVHALNGEPTWIFPDRKAAVTAFFETIARFNREGRPEERFDAVHLDVEISRRQLRAQPVVATQFVRFVESAYREARRRSMRLVFDLPTWFDEVPAGSRTLLDRIVQPGSEFVLMAYRKNQDRAFQSTQEEQSVVERAGGVLWMGVSADPAHLRATRRSSDEDFERRLRALERLIGDRPVFAGIAIHDYDRYRNVILSTPLTSRPDGGGSSDG